MSPRIRVFEQRRKEQSDCLEKGINKASVSACKHLCNHPKFRHHAILNPAWLSVSCISWLRALTVVLLCLLWLLRITLLSQLISYLVHFVILLRLFIITIFQAYLHGLCCIVGIDLLGLLRTMQEQQSYSQELCVS